MPDEYFGNKSHRRTEDGGGHLCKKGLERLLREGDIVSDLENWVGIEGAEESFLGDGDGVKPLPSKHKKCQVFFTWQEGSQLWQVSHARPKNLDLIL